MFIGLKYWLFDVFFENWPVVNYIGIFPRSKTTNRLRNIQIRTYFIELCVIELSNCNDVSFIMLGLVTHARTLYFKNIFDGK